MKVKIDERPLEAWENHEKECYLFKLFYKYKWETIGQRIFLFVVTLGFPATVLSSTFPADSDTWQLHFYLYMSYRWLPPCAQRNIAKILLARAACRRDFLRQNSWPYLYTARATLKRSNWSIVSDVKNRQTTWPAWKHWYQSTTKVVQTA